MEYIILGTRGSLPVSGRRFCEFGGSTNCILLRMGGRAIVIDAGTGILNLGKVLKEGENEIDLFISHTHADHILGLGMCKELFNPEITMNLYGKVREGRRINEQLDCFYGPPLWPINIEDGRCKMNVINLADEQMLGPVKVTTIEGVHPNGVSLFRFDCDGESVVYASDCTYSEEFLPTFVEFAKDCDVLFADGQLATAEWEAKKTYGHSTKRMAIETGKACGAKKTVLIHYDVENSDNKLREAEKKYLAEYTGVELGRQKSFGLNEKDQLSRVLELSRDLSAERDREKLLSRILDTAMEIANCDAGTLYLLEDDGLHFCRMVTKSQGVRQGGHEAPISLPPVPLKEEYASAWVAIHNMPVNVPDIRDNDVFDFSGPIRYDEITGYHTQSMLMVPLSNDKGELIGVMQLINAQNSKGKVVPFDEECENTVYATASQAAISITNMAYADQITKLLDSLVGALSTAIDERTPYNANHTRNMVKYGDNFLNWLKETNNPWEFDEVRHRTFLLSVWLHDVGKLVVPLEVMDKATRLGENLEKIKARLREKELLAKIDFLEGKFSKDEFEAQASNLKEILETVEAANSAGFMQDELYDKVLKLKDTGLFTDEELDQLFVRKGTLTAAERQVMESHVSVTAKILQNVAFPKSFAQVPAWASAHHEFLNGNGYPDHKKAEDIPREVRLLTILDIFDALTARDRPYKPGMPVEKALGILHIMAEKEGSLDPEVLRLFEESKAWEV